jgi:hypothetical protein
MDPITAGLMMGGGSILQGLGGFLGAGSAGRASQSSGMMGLLGSIMAGQAAEQGYQRAQGALSPYATAGSKSLDTLMSYLQGDKAQQDKVGGGGANLLSTFAPTMQQLEQTPGYQWARDQALGAMTNSAAAKGLGLSGNLVQGIGQTATGLASQTFQQQLENYMKQNQQAFNMLYAPAGLGASAAGGIANAAMGTAGQVGNAAMGGGTALGQGIMSQGNAAFQGTNALFGGAGNAATIGGYYGGGYNRPPTEPSSNPSSLSGIPLMLQDWLTRKNGSPLPLNNFGLSGTGSTAYNSGYGMY